MKKLLTTKWVILFAFILTLSVYFLSSPGRTPYDYFTRLAASFLEGKYYLTDNPPWLNELIPGGNSKFFVAYPPMPAIVALPFVFLFQNNFHQEYLSFLVGAGIVALTMILSLRIKKDNLLALWSGLLVGFGSIVWYLSSVGSVWYLGQITAAFFLTAALVEALGKKRSFLVGMFLGAAYLSRLQTILSLPLFLYLIKDSGWIKKYIHLALGILPFVLFNFFYNFVRFGSILDKGYFLLPVILNETNAPWFAKGVVNLAYIPNNLNLAFWSFPKILNSFPFIQPSWAGIAIWITTPAFIFALAAPIKEPSVKFSWLAILLIFLVVLSHGGTGSTQFGYRFAVDFYPILTFLTIKGVSQTGLKWHHWLLLFIGIVVNLWGVLWINKFNWVSF